MGEKKQKRKNSEKVKMVKKNQKWIKGEKSKNG